jgi:hypothetical protein
MNESFKEIPMKTYQSLCLSARVDPKFYMKAVAIASKVKRSSKWFVSSNKNKVLVFTNQRLTAWLWSSGKYRVRLKHDVEWLVDAVEEAKTPLRAFLNKGEVSSVSFNRISGKDFYLWLHTPVDEYIVAYGPAGGPLTYDVIR